MKLAERYRHLAYTPDTDDACSDAAACVMKVIGHPEPGQWARCAFKTSGGVVEAFASSTEIAGVRTLRSAVLVWSHDEHARITELLGVFR